METNAGYASGYSWRPWDKWLKTPLLRLTLPLPIMCYLHTSKPRGHTSHPLLPLTPVQIGGTYPEEDWQLDFTQRPSCKGYKYLVVYVDIFPEWIEAFHCKAEKATEVTKKFIRGNYPLWSGLPPSVQNDNGPSFIAQITEQIAQDLKN